MIRSHRAPSLARLLLITAGAWAAMSGVASADPIPLARQTCTTLGCGATSFIGIVNGDPTVPAASASEWVGQFSGLTASCLRFQVASASQGHDLAMSVVAPDGTVFTNNNAGITTCPTCPMVVIATAISGYYTVVIAHALGTAAETGFTLRAGLYNTGNNPNCLGPTTGR